MPRLVSRIPLFTCWCVTLMLSPAAFAGGKFEYYVVGNAANVVKPTRGLLVAQGGGTDVDPNYVRMGEFGGGGDFVVLRASGADEYNSYIYDLCHCDSVETLVMHDRASASEPKVIETIRNAEALFIAGGDQSNYVRFWKGTPVEDAINFVAAKPAPIGGTSAGMAVLGEFVYSAMTADSLTAETALPDPYHKDLTLERDFLDFPVFTNIITDQHLQERDRIGRTVALMARLLKDGWTKHGRAIASDRETALHVDTATGIGTVYSTQDHETPYIYFLSADRVPEHCAPGEPLTFRNIRVHRAGPGERFDVTNWRGEGGIDYELNVVDGKLGSTHGNAYGQ